MPAEPMMPARDADFLRDLMGTMLRIRAVAFVTDKSVASVARAIVARDLRIESWSRDA